MADNRANKTNDTILELTQENERKSVLPFLSVNMYLTKFTGDVWVSSIAKLYKNLNENDDKKSDKCTIIEDDLK